MLLHSRTARGGTVVLLALPLLLASRAAHAQINIGGANPLTYSQNFDSLPSSPTGTTLTFTDNVTLPGLYSNRTTFRVSNGSDTSGSLYSFGSGADRAFGAIDTVTTGEHGFAFRFVNTGTTALTGFTLSYTGELWRLGLNSAENQLLFSYAVFTAGAGSINGAGYTSVSSLDYTEAGAATPQAGGAAPIRTKQLSNGAGTAITVNPGEEVWMRLWDVNEAGNDSGLGADDVNIAFSAMAIPEPGTLVLAVIGTPMLGLVALRRRRCNGRARADAGR